MVGSSCSKLYNIATVRGNTCLSVLLFLYRLYSILYRTTYYLTSKIHLLGNTFFMIILENHRIDRILDDE